MVAMREQKNRIQTSGNPNILTCLPPKTIHRPPPTQLREMTLVIVINIRLFFLQSPNACSIYVLPIYQIDAGVHLFLNVSTQLRTHNTHYAVIFKLRAQDMLLLQFLLSGKLSFPLCSSSSLLQNQTETVEKLTNRYLKYHIKQK